MRPSRRILLAVALAVTPPAAAGAQDSLTVVGWGGAYQAAQDKAIYQPFEQSTGTKIKRESYSGGVAELKSQVAAGKVTWDVVDMEPTDAVRACDDGLLERLDGLKLTDAPDGTPADKDLIADSRSECFINAVNVAMVVAYNETAFSGAKPSRLADYFDLKAFPGKRGAYKNASRTLELALMADGVPAADVYEVLATPEGQDRAFAKLDTIRGSLVWWDAGAQAPQLLVDKEVVMSVAWNGRIFSAQQTDKKPLDILWDSQILEGSGWVIPKGAPNKALAEKFVVAAMTPQIQGKTGTLIPYGPSRRSSAAFVGVNPELGIDMKPFLPTSPDHLGNALALSAEFWAVHGDALNQRFAAWLARG
ncbi:ABC transporter substrate-binding protein [Labrys wisconsinensis]|uniref:Spermidine/putrescine transport system substrate-binding protein n=1 Tax=Labrys wisconsinensis TaxID=425677 RepID=A0ABU0J4P3_9HYPH|nr:ABC transporter substrate-binding protein [Labrys wisconsinensis]MDQ0469233.1 putative spermidine/putrescine transport system substrate-binding protein [Labrys wisconsinensis]